MPSGEEPKGALPGVEGSAAQVPDAKVAGEAAAAEATSSVKEATQAAEGAATEASEAVKESVKEGAAEAETIAAEAEKGVEKTVEEATKSLPDLNSILESGFSLDALKSSMGSFSTDGLKGLAAKISDAIQSKEGLLTSLKEQISQAIDPAKLSELKKSLESTSGLVTELKSKLGVVVDKLKESGVDVSKFTSLLGGR